jgi:hypothetical protein
LIFVVKIPTIVSQELFSPKQFPGFKSNPFEKGIVWYQTQFLVFNNWSGFHLRALLIKNIVIGFPNTLYLYGAGYPAYAASPYYAGAYSYASPYSYAGYASPYYGYGAAYAPHYGYGAAYGAYSYGAYGRGYGYRRSSNTRRRFSVGNFPRKGPPPPLAERLPSRSEIPPGPSYPPPPPPLCFFFWKRSGGVRIPRNVRSWRIFFSPQRKRGLLPKLSTGR